MKSFASKFRGILSLKQTPSSAVHGPEKKDDYVGVLSSSENPSIDYLIAPYLAELGKTVIHLGGELLQENDAAAECGSIVIVRFVPKNTIATLRRLRSAGVRIVYFMDDDLMDPAAQANLPSAYAKKVRSMATGQRGQLESLCDEFWVASQFLADKYRAWSPKLLRARPALSQVQGAPSITICYHGTASHQGELRWLVPVIESLQRRQSDTHFEVFGEHGVNKMFRGLPRTSILHPMSWANYLAYTRSVQRDIALAPLLPDPFNAARGPTKFFDFARMGAVGVYTDVAPYRGFIRDGVDGILLPNDPVRWVDTIAELAGDPVKRRQLAEAASQRALAMAWDAAAG